MKISVKYLVITLISICLVVAAGIKTARAVQENALHIGGTGSGIGTMELMAAAFQKKHPGIGVHVLPSIGSAGGIKAVAAGKLDIAVTSRPLKPEEKSPELIEEPYGNTPLVFASDAANPLRNLAMEEIEALYSGARTIWPDKRQVRLVLRPLTDAYTVYLESFSVNMKAAVAKAHAVPGVFVGATDHEAAEQIEKTPGAFGVTSLSMILSKKKRLRVFAVDGTEPTTKNLVSGRYPYFMTLSLVYRTGSYSGVVKDFVEFVYSKEGRRILEEAGHAPLPRRGRNQ